jgi:hypothetical protein
MTLSPQSPTPGPNPSNSTLNPTTSSIFRPRRSEDWHEYREIIEQLYRNDQLKLRDVKRIMERDYKFQASYVLYQIFFPSIIVPILFLIHFHRSVSAIWDSIFK